MLHLHYISHNDRISASENYPRAGKLTPPVPPRVSNQTLQNLKQSCIQTDFEGFKTTLGSSSLGSDSRDPNIFYMSGVMVQAIKLGRTCFVKELLRRGLPLSPLYVYEALKADAKGILGSLLENGWDINQPMCLMHPPILR